MEYRLVDVVGPIPPVPETTESTEEEDIQIRYCHLGRAKFIAVNGGRPVNLELNQVYYGSDGMEESDEPQEAFKFDTFMRGPVNMARSRLYVSELDEDKAD
jgi:hypothetical protein